MKRYILWSASVVLLLGAAAVGWAALKARHVTTPLEKELVRLVNQTRLEQSKPELRLDPALCKVAAAHGERMARQRTLSFPTKKIMEDKLTAAGYTAEVWSINIDALPSPDVAVIHTNWMAAYQTRGEILQSKYEEVGVAIVPDSDRSRQYFTMVFATRKK